MTHRVRRRLRFALRVDQQPARQVERRGVCEKLIEVRVGNAAVGPFVLDVADERAARPVPPGKVGLQPDAPGFVEVDAADAVVAAEHALGDPQRLPERPRDEALEHPVHVHQKARRPQVPAAGLERRVPQDEPRQRHHLAVVPVQPVERDVGHAGGRVLDERHVLQPRADPAQAVAGTALPQPHPAEPDGRRLHQAVGGDVVGELVVADFDGNGRAEPAPELIVDADAPADGGQRLFLGAVAVEQPSDERPAGGGGQRRRQRLDQRRRLRKLEALPLPGLELLHRVAGEEEHPGDLQLGADRHRQTADLDRANRGAGRQVVFALRAVRRFDGDRRQDASQRGALLQREAPRTAAFVLPQINGPHRPNRGRRPPPPPRGRACRGRNREGGRVPRPGALQGRGARCASRSGGPSRRPGPVS